MADIKLAANYISATDNIAAGLLGVRDSGHLQLVFDDGTNLLREAEVQAPDFVTVGDWQYPAFAQNHGGPTDFISATDQIEDPNRYQSVDLTLRPGQTAETVWELIGQIHASFQTNGNNINYDIQQNSNSYATTVLSIIGIDLTNQLLASATPPDVMRFPGAFVDVLQDGALETAFSNTRTPIELEVAGTSGNDYVRSGIGDDSLGGAGGNDSIIGGGGDDTIDGGAGFDLIGYEGSASEFSIDFAAKTVTQTSSSDTDTYSNAEVASFTDGIIALQTMSFAEVSTGLGLSTDEVVEAVLQAELGVGVSNVIYGGSAGAGFVVSEFDIPGEIDLEGGFLLSSGGYPGNSNTSTGFSVTNGTPGDADMSAVASAAFGGAGATQDASTIEFSLDVTDTSVTGLTFDLVFGSDEYPEYSNSSFVDVAAILVNGQNVALFNDDPTTPLSVIDNNLVNGNFIDNTGGAFATEFDGFSQVLSVRADLQQGANSIKIGVADTGDSILDSALYVTNIEYIGGGATGGGVLIVVDGSTGDDVLTAGLSNEEINLFSGTDSVMGTAAELNGDVITGFGVDDALTVVGSTFTANNIAVTFGSAILDIDTDQDGTSDTTISLEGDFSGAVFETNTVGSDTSITVSFPTSNVAPEFITPTSISVAENQTLVIDVDTTDDADLEGAGLTYSLTGGTDQSFFAIEPTTGVISFLAAPDYEAPADTDSNNIFDVEVTVTDSGGLSAKQSIAVTVTDVDDTPAVNIAPSINSSSIVSVAENQTAVIDVNATDDADSEGSGLTFSLTGGPDQSLFAIDPSTGVISFLAAPDFEAPADADSNNIFDVEVTVSDSGALFDTQAIAVAVLDVDETTPTDPTTPTQANYDNIFIGDANNNPIQGTADNDWIDGKDGNDKINGADGDDYIIAGPGNDWFVRGGMGADVFQFGIGDGGVKIYDFEDGVDLINLVGGLTLDDMTQTMQTFGGITSVIFKTTNGDRLILRDQDPSDIDANDIFVGADDPNSGGPDEDMIILGDGSDENLSGGSGNDRLNGRAGEDTLNGGAGNDQLNSGIGNDVLNGGAGNDRLIAKADDDVLNGGADMDTLFGGEGDDTLDGGDGNDRVQGQQGSDLMTGGAGSDIFIWDHYQAGSDGDADVIADLDFAEDQLIIRSFGANPTSYVDSAAELYSLNLSGLTVMSVGGDTLITQDEDGTSHSLLLQGVEDPLAMS